ncbi:hypothetical protein Anapl_14338 [Anas platyrhynchos]|uniref:Uncharacterized protein n=1 Tax=Anas platyrhynchos TaxID=8839 RepID=R0LAG0_ANAPL|nr:hypothetical protein Anapl_14338 [Anas platyrhynchos]
MVLHSTKAHAVSDKDTGVASPSILLESQGINPYFPLLSANLQCQIYCTPFTGTSLAADVWQAGDVALSLNQIAQTLVPALLTRTSARSKAYPVLQSWYSKANKLIKYGVGHSGQLPRFSVPFQGAIRRSFLIACPWSKHSQKCTSQQRLIELPHFVHLQTRLPNCRLGSTGDSSSTQAAGRHSYGTLGLHSPSNQWSKCSAQSSSVVPNTQLKKHHSGHQHRISRIRHLAPSLSNKLAFCVHMLLLPHRLIRKFGVELKQARNLRRPFGKVQQDAEGVIMLFE